MSHSPNIERGLYVEDLFTLPRPDCMVPAHWHTYDIQGTEVEVIEMVAGMIRGQQPEVVRETGTSRGYMTQAIGNALLRNGHGVVYTYEPDALTLSEAFETWGGGAERLPIIARGQESMQEWTQEPIDFAWHDSLLDLRLPEFNF